MKCPSVSGTNWLCWWQVSITWKFLRYKHVLLPPLLEFDRNAVSWCWYRKLKNFVPFNTAVLNSRHMNDISYTSGCWNFFISNTFYFAHFPWYQSVWCHCPIWCFRCGAQTPLERCVDFSKTRLAEELLWVEFVGLHIGWSYHNCSCCGVIWGWIQPHTSQ